MSAVRVARPVTARTASSVGRQQRRLHRPRRGVAPIIMLAVVSLIMLVPLYLLIINAFKSQSDILAHPFSVRPDLLSLSYLQRAWDNPDFSIVKGYAVSGMFVIGVNVLSLALAGPASYVIARRVERRYRMLLLLFVAGTFIPSQVLVIPVVYTLKFLGLMNSIAGFLLFETTLTLPFSIFLYVGFITTIPSSLDEAAAMDGANRYRIFVSIILPLMRPAVVTMIILNTFSVWNDFVNPQIILGPTSGLYTVTTGIYAAVGQYSTDYTVVFPTLLLAILPILAVFIVLQRHIVSGLTAGATKG